MLKIAVIVEQCEEGGFAVHVPTIPGCYGQGETIDEALASIKDGIEMHLEAVEDDLVVDDNCEIFEMTWDTAPQTRAYRQSTPQGSGSRGPLAEDEVSPPVSQPSLPPGALGYLSEKNQGGSVR